jgi:hypothetical protein
MSFLYPRTISVRRQKIPAQGSVGVQPYGGDQPANEAVILTGIAAGVQKDRIGSASPSNLPSSSKLPYYIILIPAASAPLGTINKNDIVVDDLGVRYQVHDPYWTPLGYQLGAEMMTV